MVKILFRTLLLLLLAALAFGIYWYGFRTPSDSEQIAKRIGQLAGDLSKAEKENVALGLLKAESAPEYFTDPFEFQWEGVGAGFISGPMSGAEVTANFQRLRSMLQRSAVSAEELDIQVVSADYAVVTFSGTIDAVMKSGERWIESRDIRCDLIKVDGKWRITRAACQELLRH